MIGEVVPLSVVEQMARQMSDDRRRIGELERLLQRRQAVVWRGEHGFAGTTSADTPALVAQLSGADLGARGVPGVYTVSAMAYLTFVNGPDYYELEIKSNGVTYASNRINAGHGVAVWDGTYSVSGMVRVTGDVAVPIELWLTRTPGATGGFAQFYGTDPRYVQLQAIFIPD